MTVTLKEAARVLTKRKLAALGIEEAPEVLGETMDLEEMRMLMVGMDIDVDEVSEAVHGVMQQSALLIAMGGLSRFPQILGGAWVDGLLTGVMLAELRHKEQTKES